MIRLISATILLAAALALGACRAEPEPVETLVPAEGGGRTLDIAPRPASDTPTTPTEPAPI